MFFLSLVCALWVTGFFYMRRGWHLPFAERSSSQAVFLWLSNERHFFQHTAKGPVNR